MERQLRTLMLSLACLVVTCSAITTEITATNLCANDCVMKDVVLNFPDTVSQDGPLMKFDWSFKANMTEDMSYSWRYGFTAISGPGGPLAVKAWNETGIPCGYTFVGDLWWFMLEMSLPECGTKAGEVEVKGKVRFQGTAAPGVPTVAHLNMQDASGYPALKLEIHFTHPLTELSAADSAGFVAPLALAMQDREDQSLVSPVDQKELVSGSPVEELQWPHIPHLAIKATNCCDDACLLKNVRLNFPTRSPHSGFDFKLTGELEQSVRDLRFGLDGTLKAARAVPLHVLAGNGSACGLTTISDPNFQIDLGFETCPVTAGEYVLSGRAKPPFPFIALGSMAIQVEVTERESNLRIGCVNIDMRFESSGRRRRRGDALRFASKEEATASSTSLLTV